MQGSQDPKNQDTADSCTKVSEMMINKSYQQLDCSSSPTRP